MTTLGEGLLADQTGTNKSQFRVQVEGTSRDLVPVLCDEVYRIAGEALRNAFRHAGANRIEVDITTTNGSSGCGCGMMAGALTRGF
jgi:signal transduction histidine kinase